LDHPGKLRFRVRGSAGSGRLDWLPNANAAAADTKSSSFTITTGEWEEVTADLPAPPGRPGIMRLYLPAQHQTILVHWIELTSGDSLRRWEFNGK